MTIAEQIPPCNLESERFILSSIMYGGKQTAFEAFEIIISTDFYDVRNEKLFTALTDMAVENLDYDIVLIGDYLEQKGLLKEIGIDYLIELNQKNGSPAQIKHYCRIIKEKSLKRQLIQNLGKTLELCYDNSTDVFELMENAYTEIEKSFSEVQTDGYDSLENIAQNYIQKLETSLVSGLKTGFEKLDEITGTLKGGDYIIIAAATSMGKTAFLHSLIDNWINKSGILFSLEMSKEQNLTRLITMNTQIPANLIRSGNLYEGAKYNIKKYLENLDSKIIFYDKSINIKKLKMLATKLHRIHKFEFLLIDYLQLVGSIGNNDNEKLALVSSISKNLAKDLDIPVIALSQFNREACSKGDHRPTLNGLRGSGMIENDSDMVFAIHRPYYWLSPEEKQNLKPNFETDVELIPLKNRLTGILDTIKIWFDTKKAKFIEPQINSHFQETEKAAF